MKILEFFRKHDTCSEELFYPETKIIFAKNSITHLFVIKEGFVKVTVSNQKTKKSTLLYLSPGDIFPFFINSSDEQITSYDYIALAPTSLLSVSLKEANRKLENSFSALSLIHRRKVHYLKECLEVSTALKSKSTKNKLKIVLPYIQRKVNSKPESRKFVVPGFLTFGEIAELIGATRESISTHLNDPKCQKLYFTDKGKRYFDLKYLNSLD